MPYDAATDATQPEKSPMNPWTNISPPEVRALRMEKPGLVILDVRTAEEFTAHHLPGAALIPIQELGAVGRG